MLLVTALIIAPILLPVEVCVQSPEPPALEPPAWHWRMLAGRRCYFRADTLLPTSELFWESDETDDAAELDRRMGTTVIERRPVVLLPLEERPAPRKRLRLRRRRREEDDDDD